MKPVLPPVTFEPITREELNAHLILWGHKMGEIHRPTRGWSHGLRHEGPAARRRLGRHAHT